MKQLADTNFGDSDLDGEVAFNDFLAVANSFDQPSGWAGGDFDGNGLTDFQDFLLLANNFGKRRESDVASAPESCSGGALLLSDVTEITTRAGYGFTGYGDEEFQDMLGYDVRRLGDFNRDGINGLFSRKAKRRQSRGVV